MFLLPNPHATCTWHPFTKLSFLVSKWDDYTFRCFCPYLSVEYLRNPFELEPILRRLEGWSLPHHEGPCRTVKRSNEQLLDGSIDIRSSPPVFIGALMNCRGKVILGALKMNGVCWEELKGINASCYLSSTLDPGSDMIRDGLPRIIPVPASHK